MPEEYFMFNSVDGDREVTAEDFSKYFGELITDGVFYRNNEPSLKIDRAINLENVLQVGAAFIQGYMYRNTTQIRLFHAPGNASFPRIDRIVIRLDRSLSERNIRVFIKPGTPATNPLPPALERNSVIYELSLAQVRINAGATVVASLTDERLNENLCGIVNSLAELPTDIFLADMVTFKTRLQQEWDAFIGSIQTEAPALGGMLISVQDTPPANPKNKDIWIDTR